MIKPKQVRLIPVGFGAVTSYLVISGAGKAIEFYQKAFGVKELTRNVLSDGRILNAQTKIGTK